MEVRVKAHTMRTKGGQTVQVKEHTAARADSKQLAVDLAQAMVQRKEQPAKPAAKKKKKKNIDPFAPIEGQLSIYDAIEATGGKKDTDAHNKLFETPPEQPKKRKKAQVDPASLPLFQHTHTQTPTASHEGQMSMFDNLAKAARLSLIDSVARTLNDLQKAMVQVKQHQRKTKTGTVVVQQHQRNILTRGERKDMIAAMADRIGTQAGGHVKDVPGHHVHHIARALAKQTGKAVYVSEHPKGGFRVSHSKPKGAHMKVTAEGTRISHSDGDTMRHVDVSHAEARKIMRKADKAKASDAKPKREPKPKKEPSKIGKNATPETLKVGDHVEMSHPDGRTARLVLTEKRPMVYGISVQNPQTIHIFDNVTGSKDGLVATGDELRHFASKKSEWKLKHAEPVEIGDVKSDLRKPTEQERVEALAQKHREWEASQKERPPLSKKDQEMVDSILAERKAQESANPTPERKIYRGEGPTDEQRKQKKEKARAELDAYNNRNKQAVMGARNPKIDSSTPDHHLTLEQYAERNMADVMKQYGTSDYARQEIRESYGPNSPQIQQQYRDTLTAAAKRGETIPANVLSKLPDGQVYELMGMHENAIPHAYSVPEKKIMTADPKQERERQKRENQVAKQKAKEEQEQAKRVAKYKQQQEEKEKARAELNAAHEAMIEVVKTLPEGSWVKDDTFGTVRIVKHNKTTATVHDSFHGEMKVPYKNPDGTSRLRANAEQLQNWRMQQHFKRNLENLPKKPAAAFHRDAVTIVHPDDEHGYIRHVVRPWSTVRYGAHGLLTGTVTGWDKKKQTVTIKTSGGAEIERDWSQIRPENDGDYQPIPKDEWRYGMDSMLNYH